MVAACLQLAAQQQSTRRTVAVIRQTALLYVAANTVDVYQTLLQRCAEMHCAGGE